MFPARCGRLSRTAQLYYSRATGLEQRGQGVHDDDNTGTHLDVYVDGDYNSPRCDGSAGRVPCPV